MSVDETEETSRRLAEAESNVARALLRLQEIRRASLKGEFDSQVYDEALHRYREAEYEAYSARRAWTLARAAMPAQAGSAVDPAGDPVAGAGGADPGEARAAAPAEGPSEVATPAPEAEPFQPTDAMRFIRWLVQQGRISEWNVTEQTAAPAEAGESAPSGEPEST